MALNCKALIYNNASATLYEIISEKMRNTNFGCKTVYSGKVGYILVELFNQTIIAYSSE